MRAWETGRHRRPAHTSLPTLEAIGAVLRAHRADRARALELSPELAKMAS